MSAGSVQAGRLRYRAANTRLSAAERDRAAEQLGALTSAFATGEDGDYAATAASVDSVASAGERQQSEQQLDIGQGRGRGSSFRGPSAVEAGRAQFASQRHGARR